MEDLLEIIKQSLLKFLMDKRWFDRKTESQFRVEIEDYYSENHGNGMIVLAILKIYFNGNQSKLYYLPVYLENIRDAVPLCIEGEYIAEIYDKKYLLKEIDYTKEYDIVSLLLFAKRTLNMKKRGRILFRSQTIPDRAVQITDTKPIQKNVSTNCVNYQKIQGFEVVHKIYKQLRQDNQEIAIFNKIQNRDFNVPKIFGYYIYEDSSGIQYPLGIIVEYCYGNTIDVFLNQNIRSLWEKASLFMSRDKEKIRSIITEHLASIKPIITRFGQEILVFHKNMNQMLQTEDSNKEFHYQGYLGDLRNKAISLLEQVNKEENISTIIQKKISEALLKIANIQEPNNHDYRCSFPHGDLHMSNIICNKEQSYQLKIVDFGTKKLRLEQNVNQNVFEDIGWIVRSLEYFVYDEVNRELSLKFHLSEEAISQYRFDWNILEQKQDSPFFDMVQLIEWIGDTWKAAVTQMIMQGYFESKEAYQYILTHPDNFCQKKLDKLWEKIYLTVLMSQLEYNYNYKRDYYKQFDFYYLWKFL